MSHAASKYVKKLRHAPNGELLTIQEKAVLQHIADSHNDEEHAAWTSVRVIAADCMVSERRTREIIGELIRKRVLWRRFRKEEKSGRDTTNYWHFTELDGEAPVEVQVAEEANHVKANRRAHGQTVAMFSTEACEPPCETSQGTGAESRRDGCDVSQGETAESRRGGMRAVAGGDCDASQGETAESRSP